MFTSSGAALALGIINSIVRAQCLSRFDGVRNDQAHCRNKERVDKKKIKDVIHTETEVLKRAIDRMQEKLRNFETQYGTLDSSSLYGKIDDMELVEWEGELETLERLKHKFPSLEEITIEYR